MLRVVAELLRGRWVAKKEGERAARREEGEFLDKPTTLLRGGGGAHLRISSRDGANVAGCGGAAATALALSAAVAMVASVGGVEVLGASRRGRAKLASGRRATSVSTRVEGATGGVW